MSPRRNWAQSTYIYRAPQCMSPRRNWDSPNPFAASECALPPWPKGGGAHPPAPKGVGEFQFRRWRKSLALCLLCGIWTLPTPLSPASVPLPPYSPAGEGLGESQFRRLEKKLSTLPTLWRGLTRLKRSGFKKGMLLNSGVLVLWLFRGTG
jgi:hypothetical protein